MYIFFLFLLLPLIPFDIRGNTSEAGVARLELRRAGLGLGRLGWACGLAWWWCGVLRGKLRVYRKFYCRAY